MVLKIMRKNIEINQIKPFFPVLSMSTGFIFPFAIPLTTVHSVYIL